MSNIKKHISSHFSSQSNKTVDAIAKVLSNKASKKTSVKDGVDLVKLSDELAKQKLEQIRQGKDEDKDDE